MMEKNWVILNKKFIIRPNRDGIEFVTPEKNFSLELIRSEKFRKEILNILYGLDPLPKDTYICSILNSLKEKGILEFTHIKPKKNFILSENERKLWEIRNNFVGKRSPIRDVYHIDSSKSSFSSTLTKAVSAKYIINGTTREGWTGGSDEDVIIAEIKAVMEGLERWSSGVIPENDLIKSSARNLGSKALSPKKIVSYSNKQYKRKLFPLVKYSQDNIYYWKTVTSYFTKKIYYLPVECLYYPVSKKLIPNPYTFASSSGVAAGFSYEDALYRGICEAIERDAFMNVWLNRLSLPRIKNDSLPDKIKIRIDDFNKLNYKVYIVDITLDLIPSVLVVVKNSKTKPALIISGASRFDMESAISKALDEAEYILSWQLRYSDRIRLLKNTRKATGVLDHIAVFADPKNINKAKFLWEGIEIDYKSLNKSNRNSLSDVLDLFKSKNIDIIVADLTPPLLKKKGIFIIKSIPIDLVPISFGYGLEPLGMKRIDNFRSKNPWPRNTPFLHPFA